VNDDDLGPDVRRMLHRLDDMAPAAPAFETLSPRPGSGHRRTGVLLVAAVVVVVVGVAAALLLRSPTESTISSARTTSPSSTAAREPGNRGSAAGPMGSDRDTDTTDPTATSTAAPPSSTGPGPGQTVDVTTAGAPSTAPPTTASTQDAAPEPCGEAYRDNDQYPLRRCDSGYGVSRVRFELAAQGYLLADPAESVFFTDEVEEAVRAFQRDHGLEVDGLVGPLTWMELTADYQARIGFDPNGDGRLDPWEIGVIGDANAPCDASGAPDCPAG
jgi:hypothetical protein